MDGNYGNHNEEYHKQRDEYFYKKYNWKTIRVDLNDIKKYQNNKKEYIKIMVKINI